VSRKKSEKIGKNRFQSEKISFCQYHLLVTRSSNMRASGDAGMEWKKSEKIGKNQFNRKKSEKIGKNRKKRRE
jgi:hypothetical protein